MKFPKAFRFPRYALEYLLVKLFFHLCRCVSMESSSAWAGGFARFLGPKLSISDLAKRQLDRVFPRKSDEEKKRIILGMWENLGRTFGEYPHLDRLAILSDKAPVIIEDRANLMDLQKTGRPLIFFLGHLANWEYATMPAKAWGFHIAQLYRPLNNPFLRRFITHYHLRIASALVPKGAGGARQMIQWLQQGNHLSMLVDQKLNEGLSLPFLGYPAMTAPALAKLALKYDGHIVPVQVIREAGTRCRIIYHPPLTLEKGSLSHEEKVTALMGQVNDHLSQWILAHPQDWLWIHKRWGKVPPL